MREASTWSICRLGYVETARAIGLARGARALRSFRAEWPTFEVVEVDARLSEVAAEVAVSDGLRSLDAIHLAAALQLPRHELVFATWDQRLWRAARGRGLKALPASW
ncbi:MAG: type II toxin-antitoxin system VapC family toxin [Solirubrobacterales bacterium]|nr:type II toxin-antitoxin system VapC family toxin [Solirubrobacterales bacterium]